MPDRPPSTDEPFRTDLSFASDSLRLAIDAVDGKGRPHVCPRKVQADAAIGAWERDLQVDLDRLRKEFVADRLICVLKDDELAELGIATLRTLGQLPDCDSIDRLSPMASFPDATQDVAGLVSEIAEWAAGGENVVVQCRAAWAGAGTVGGCVLRAVGMDAAPASRSRRDLLPRKREDQVNAQALEVRIA